MKYKKLYDRAQQFRAKTSLMRYRHITIAQSFKVADQLDRVAALILKTGHDFASHKESFTDYNARSIERIASEIKPSFKSTTLALMKVNQSVIDYKKSTLEKKIKPKFYGHIWSGIFLLSESKNSLIHLNGSLLSKTNSFENKFFEAEKTILDKQLITPKKHAQGTTHGSSEYYLFFEPNRLNLDLKAYVARVNHLNVENARWDVNSSACGQAVYFACTSKKLGINQSPQTAGVKSIFELLRQENATLRDNMQRALTESKLSLLADEIDYLNLENRESLNLSHRR